MVSIGRFVIYFSIYALIIFGLAFGMSLLWSNTMILSANFIPLFIFLFSLTIIVYFLGLMGIKEGSEFSVFTLLGGIVIKMVMSMSLILYMFIKFPDNQRVLALNFFSLYLLFSLFEVTVMLRNLRHQNKK